MTGRRKGRRSNDLPRPVTVASRDERGFPQAFECTIDQLRRAIQDDAEPEISGNVALGTVALCEPAYRDAADGEALVPQAMLHEMVGR